MSLLIHQQRGFGKANLVLSGNKLIILDENGELGIAVVGPDGFDFKSRAQVLSKPAFTGPTLAGTNPYLRDRKVIKALDLSDDTLTDKTN